MNSLELVKYALLIIVVVMLGFNIFLYLGHGPDVLAMLLGKTAKKGLRATKTVVGKRGEKLKQDIIDFKKKAQTTLGDEFRKLENLVETPITEFTGATSLLNKVQKRGKSGYCYVGTDRGYRSCVDVGNNDICMSGQVFPSREICIHPSLRM